MSPSTVAATSVALVLAFAAIVVSLVHARDPFDRSVARSFDSRVARLARRGTVAVPGGCDKRSVDIYACSALVRPRGRLESVRARYRLWLADDGCWTTDPPVEVGDPAL